MNKEAIFVTMWRQLPNWLKEREFDRLDRLSKQFGQAEEAEETSRQLLLQ